MGDSRALEKRKKPIRQSNFELLRIFAILLIIGHHFTVHGGFGLWGDEVITKNIEWLILIQIGGKIGVDIFILISGYFLVTSTSIKTAKVFKLWLQLIFYSLVIYFVFCFYFQEQFSRLEFFKNCLPIAFKKWWFASVYFVLFLISPYLNKLLNALTKQQYLRALILLGVLWVVIPTFLPVDYESSNLAWFIYLYAVAGYIRLFNPKFKLPSICWLLLAAGVIFISWRLTISLYLNVKVNYVTAWFYPYYGNLYDANKMTIFLISLFLFIGFAKMKTFRSRLINLISSATFGVYLIHDSDYVRGYIWSNVFKNATYIESEELIKYSISVIFIVFGVCTAIELIRIFAFEKTYMPVVESIGAKIDSVIYKTENSVSKKLGKSE